MSKGFATKKLLSRYKNWPQIAVCMYNFVEECIKLSNGTNNNVYYMQEQRNMVVYFELIASLGDQPESRSMNYLMLENSAFSSRYGYAANVGAIW